MLAVDPSYFFFVFLFFLKLEAWIITVNHQSGVCVLFLFLPQQRSLMDGIQWHTETTWTGDGATAAYL